MFKEHAMLIQSNGAIRAYLSPAATAIIAAVKTAAAQHALGMFATLETENGVRMNYGKWDQIHNTAPGADILTKAALYAKAMPATKTTEDGAQIPHGLL